MRIVVVSLLALCAIGCQDSAGRAPSENTEPYVGDIIGNLNNYNRLFRYHDDAMGLDCIIVESRGGHPVSISCVKE